MYYEIYLKYTGRIDIQCVIRVQIIRAAVITIRKQVQVRVVTLARAVVRAVAIISVFAEIAAVIFG